MDLNLNKLRKKYNTVEKLLELRIHPPKQLIGKFGFYLKRYGFVHTGFSFASRMCPALWNIFGKIVSQRFLDKWAVQEGLKIVNLGGGNLLLDDWLCADVDPRADVFVSVTESLPFKDESIDVVFCEEVIEHVKKEEGFNLVSECLRVLKPGGCLRLSTPRLEYFIENFFEEPSETSALNNIFYLHGHKHIFSEMEMEMFLREFEFKNIRQSAYREAESALGFFDSHPARFAFAPPDCSQYWECIK